ncbi:nitrate reductase [Flavobacterium johnsoniae]|uniref:Assimilatory nitrate reductase (NADH) beta subunit / assimilatory nitrate reductase (NADH) alpha subunit apoprotein n=1 Tax=Flavobacterium johnsoniae (strain ATCC 17061 / DSM 2064 / JCM 8514 / BCRC 14874 / CCUG 350202 / NBRC 14942 / NCIMB 11054 / UW101) TaxID=376686 RepID=A5FAY2_FLAJ1|nr:nitrate reductase [Flavobacterium johnsoniae]ABQ07632.1 assimilatory nitrate reductase (NADH) beta subunit / assimilatory nitrate reductase (NADH) alpha subunit apoprotein [Flavobacterium johnsoniae UW101]OXE99526.1 NAD(P)H-nitrite reductase [Flavobacterium johnsoniae UW101]WQG80530.1 molybdopterin-dependent oxidoreductase [Flavobacterium johnsoniae UW101]SHL07217.1 assimilatory nitrate reductase (NADH) beta subunit /assimilatory nitrate reductase (NADH) alpha subunit apoprotein [Flavobacter
MQTTKIKTTCSYCGVGCGIIVTNDAKNGVMVEGDKDHPVNKGMLCSKGMNLHYVVNDTSDRILYPEMRGSKFYPLERVSWDTALDRAAAVFSSIIKKHGPDSVGFYISGQCLTEEYYLVNKLVKGFLKTNNIDTNSRLCMSSAVVGYKKTFGEDSVPIAYDDIELADTFLITGANPAWCHPILFRRLEKHKEKNPKTKIICIDPRRTDTAAFADLHLQIIPGSDIILYHAIAKRIIEKGYVDHDFVKNHAENFKQYKDLVLGTSLEKASKLCGISVNDIKLAADLIGKAKGFISLWAMGLNQSAVGVDKNTALLNLSLLTGQVGKPGSGPFSLTGQPNAMGGREVGGMATLLAAHKDIANPAHRKEVADFWGVDEISDKPGLTATEMFEALESGKMKAVWIICTNPLVSLPDSRRAEKALQNAKFVVVQDISHNADTAKFADLLLPAAGWLEKEGTMTNSERRISYLPKGINPPGEALPDIEILIRFAKKMNFNGFNFNSAEEVYKEHCALTKNTNIDISFLNYNRLKTEGTFQWPVPDYNHPGTPRLFTDKKFYTPSGKAIFNLPVSIENTSVQPNDEFPFILTTGRIRDQWHTMTKTGKVSRLLTHIPSPVLEINPIDAFKNEIKNGDIVVISSKNGEVRVKAKVTDSIKEKVVFLPMHWGKQLENDLNRTNNLTNTVVDPVSKEPDFKFTTVSIKKYVKPFQKIAIVGAGAASFRFIQNYREFNSTDEIIVFSNEINPFYNRVLLPEYMTGEFTWEQLLKVKDGETLNKLNITMKAGVSIDKIDTGKKTILDSQGEIHTFDSLILATGSRPFVPENAQLHLPGRFTVRRKEDADRLKKHLDSTNLPPEEQHVVIIGGGLLGLELAAALKHKKVKTTIIQRASRLMERQLDRISSKLLAEEVQLRDIQIYFDNEVSTVFETDYPNEIEIALKSGKIITANAIVYTIGTIPNIEIARESGLACGRGVKVNQYLQTSNPNIFAIGEIAEFNNKLFGITSAAEEQADILANYLAGDISSYYKGSILMNILKLEDINLCSIGDLTIPENDDSYEEIVFTDLKKRYYKKCIVKDDLLVGAILMGDKNEFAEFKTMIESKIELSDKRNTLLRGSSNAKPVLGKLVCSCSQVGAGNIEETIKSGVSDFTDLCKNTGAGLGCGSCKTEVKEILAKCK